MAGSPRSATAWILVAIAGLGAVALAVALIALWPGADRASGPSEALARGELVEATVVAVDPRGCAPEIVVSPEVSCRRVSFTLEEGPRAGRTIALDLSDTGPMLQVDEGDRVILETLVNDIPGPDYALYDVDRTSSLLWLALAFAALVVLLGRLRGLAALVGLGLSLLLLLRFVLPAILAGSSPTLVACVGAGVIAYGVIYLAHGFTVRTTVAVLGTIAGLGLAAVLSMVWVPLATLTGLATETSYVIQATGVQVDPAGLLLAGIVIGALGAIDDVSVTQASAVWELRAADPEADGRGLFRSGMRVGRDHVGSIVNTLALAYVGASLPLLIVFRLSDLPFERVLGSEIVAIEIVRALIGSIGLVAAMPITTWLAAHVAAHEPVSDRAEGGHTHARV